MPTANAFHWSLIIGLLMLLPGCLLLTGGRAASAALHALPRSVWAGRVLTTLAWIGAGWAAWAMPLSFLEPYKRFLPLVVLICIPLSWYWLDDLLTCRATGGLLMLFPAPLLLCLRSHPSPWRLLLVVVAYLALVQGMTLMLYPWYMRRVCHTLAANATLRIAGGAVGVLTGAAILVIGTLALR